VTIGPVTLQLI